VRFKNVENVLKMQRSAIPYICATNGRGPLPSRRLYRNLYGLI
jgi:hypothetical protein